MNLRKENKRLFGIWCGMKGRCQNPKRPKYPIYGARGITVCDEWKRFKPFYEWAMANGYQDNLTIDRIDNSGNYCPENCRWATATEQCRNRSTTLKATYCGETRTVAEWASITGVDYYLLRSRLRRGCDMETALTAPLKTHKYYKKKRRGEDAVQIISE